MPATTANRPPKTVRRKHPLIERCLEDLRTEGLAEGSLDLYGRQFYAYVATLKRRDRTPRNATHEDILAHFAGLRDRNRATTLRSIASILNTFYEWGMEMEGWKRNPIPRRLRRGLARRARTEPVVRDVPTVEQFLRLRNHVNAWLAERPQDRDHVEFRCAFELMAGCGVRAEAFGGLTPSHIDWQLAIIRLDDRLDNKGNKLYKPPVTPFALAVLYRYLQDWPVEPNDRLWSRDIQSFRERLHQCAESLPITVTPHCLRHFYATMLYFQSLKQPSTNGDIVYVRNALGHSSIGTTDIYTHLADEVCASEELWRAWVMGTPVDEERLKQPRRSAEEASEEWYNAEVNWGRL